MQQKYQEQVKCVYTDPPYNTKGDGFPYKDSYKHSSWASMMLDRLSLAYGILRDDGVIAHYIDENEHILASQVLSAVFGEENRVGDVVWKNSSKNDQAYVSMQHEYLIAAVKNRSKNKGDWVEKKEGLDEIYAAFDTFKKKHGTNWTAIHESALGWYKQFPESNPIADSKHYTWMDELGIYFPDNISGPNFGQYRYDVYHNVTGKVVKEPASGWRYPESTMLERIKSGLVHFGKDETTVPNNKTYLKNTEYQSLTSIKYRDGRVASKALNAMFGEKTFANPKDSDLSIRFLKAYKTVDSSIIDYFGGTGTTAHAVINLNREDDGKRKYILVEQNNYFDTVLKPRIQKVVYSKDWKDGKPIARVGISHSFKTLRLESYEDTLNNLTLKTDAHRDIALANNPDLQRDYLLNYFIDVETQTSQSLLNIADFRDPTAYKMNIKKPGSEEQSLQAIDLIETFNWLIGLWVSNIAAAHSFNAEFEREQDPDLPNDQKTRLICKRLKVDDKGDYWFRLIEGYTLKVPGDETSKVATLIIWRKQTADAEKDNVVLQKFLMDKLGISPRAQTYDVIYINGSHTLPNPVVEGEKTKVRLIEEAFHNAMWSGE